MSIRKTLFASLLAWAVFLVLDPAFSSFRSLSSPAESPSSTPKTPPAAPARSIPPVSIPPVGGAAPVQDHASAILGRAIERLRSVTWLEVEIRQNRNQRGSRWNAVGTLRRAPGGCARLEMTVTVGEGMSTRSRVISDGRALAQVTSLGDEKPKVIGLALPQDAAARDEILRRHGCGGPLGVLHDVLARVSTWDVARREGNELVLSGTLSRTANEAALAAIGIEARRVRVRLEEVSQWPRRVEWLGESEGEVLWDLEYLRPRLDTPITADECARHFTYSPD